MHTFENEISKSKLWVIRLWMTMGLYFLTSSFWPTCCISWLHNVSWVEGIIVKAYSELCKWRKFGIYGEVIKSTSEWRSLWCLKHGIRLFFQLWGRWIGDHPQEDLAQHKSRILFHYILAKYNNLCSKYDKLHFLLPPKTSFGHVTTPYFWSPSGKILS